MINDLTDEFEIARKLDVTNVLPVIPGADETNGFAPSFVEKPCIIPNETGTLITMKCLCKAKPEPTVCWYKGDDIVQVQTGKINMVSTCVKEDHYEIVLEIMEPSAHDGGNYRCNVKNEFGESNANLNLNIEAEPEPEGEGPTFLSKPKISSENSSLVQMVCHVRSKPPPTVEWTHEGKRVTESSKIKMKITEISDEEFMIVLELADPDLDDSGLYKCNIKNQYGELNANLTLNVEIVPIIKEKPKIIKIIKKRTAIIECIVVSKFEPKCNWFKETKQITIDNRHACKIEKNKEGEFTVKLEISNVEQTDIGSYKLVASNERGEAQSQTVELTDLQVADKPIISKHLQSQYTVKENKNVTLDIEIKSSDKSCKVTWTRDDVVLRNVRSEFDGKVCKLFITKSNKTTEGRYRVIVSNENGSDESSTTVVVEESEETTEETEEITEEETIEETKEEETVEEKTEKTEKKTEKKEKKTVDKTEDTKTTKDKKVTKKVEEKHEETKSVVTKVSCTIRSLIYL